jgi:hypothetical protein
LPPLSVSLPASPDSVSLPLPLISVSANRLPSSFSIET